MRKISTLLKAIVCMALVAGGAMAWAQNSGGTGGTGAGATTPPTTLPPPGSGLPNESVPGLPQVPNLSNQPRPQPNTGMIPGFTGPRSPVIYSPTDFPLSPIADGILPQIQNRLMRQQAEEWTNETDGNGGDGTSPTIIGGGGGGGGYGQPPYAAYAHGLADIIRSAGMADMLGSESAKNAETALRRRIENRERWTEAYFQMRMINEAHRAALRGPRPTEEDWIRYAQAGKPERLAPSEFDPISGRIHWPVLLDGAKYQAQREALENLFAYRASAGGVNRTAYLQIDQLTNEMMEQLRAEVDDLPAEDYIRARRFLEALAYEAMLPAG
jgi:hypothetical protein